MFQGLQHVFVNPFKRSHSQDCGDGQTANTLHGRDDRTEDGFLLVGKTTSERTIIHAKGFRSDIVDPPPGYNETHRELPTYTEYSSNRAMFNPTLDVSQTPFQQLNSLNTASPTIQTWASNDFEGYTESVDSPIKDIPFVVADQLGSQKLIDDLKSRFFLVERSFNVSHYEYDFRLEMSVLQENDHIMDER